MKNIHDLRSEMEEHLKGSTKQSLYACLGLLPTCSDNEIKDAISRIRSDKHAGRSLSAEQVYAIDLLGAPISREQYDRQLFKKIAVNRVQAGAPIDHPSTTFDDMERRKSRSKPWLLLFGLPVLIFLVYAGFPSIKTYTQTHSRLVSGPVPTATACLRNKPPSYSSEERKAAIGRLEAKGVVVNSQNLVEAVELADALTVSDLLKSGVNPNIAPPSSDQQPIWSVRFGAPGLAAKNIEVVQILVSHGAELNNPSRPTLTAAIRGNELEIAKYLIGQCADVNLRSISNTSDHTPLTEAIDMGAPEMVRLLVKNGANVNLPGQASLHPLQLAAVHTLESVKILVENGTNVSIVGDGGWTPLIVALNSKNFDTARYLIERGANTNSVAYPGFTAMQLAKKMERQDIVDLLRSKGVKD